MTRINDKQDGMEFRKLPESYSNSGMKFNLVKRGDKAAMYLHKGDGYFVHEVFCIKVAKAGFIKFKGIITEVPDRERVPGNEDFGKWAWCISGPDEERSYERADEIFGEIERGERFKHSGDEKE